MALTQAELNDYLALRDLWRKDPLLYGRQRLGLNPTWQQAKILEAIAPSGAKVTARAGHGIGKTGAVSTAIWWHMECFEFSKCPCTAPTKNQLSTVLWPELAKWRRKADEQAKRMGLPPELWLGNLFEVTGEKIIDRGAPNEWFVVARTSRKENPAALAGFHATDVTISADGKSVSAHSSTSGRMMFVIEEASGVPDEIFEVAEGALSDPESRMLMVGNPTRSTGYFARSHRQDRALFSSLHFKSSESPLVGSDYRERLVRKFGEGSNVVRVRCDGEFPRQDDDTLIPLEDAEGAITRDASEAAGKRRLGVDVAEFGGDRTVLTIRQGAVVERIEIYSKLETMETVGHVVTAANKFRIDVIYVDSNGLGAGVASRLTELKTEGKIAADVVRVNVSKAAPDRPDDRDAQARTLRDFVWLEVAQWLREAEPSFALCDRDTAEDLAGELATVKFRLDSEGRIVVESKEDMKKRLKGKSPDLADSLALTFAPNTAFVLPSITPIWGGRPAVG